MATLTPVLSIVPIVFMSCVQAICTVLMLTRMSCTYVTYIWVD